jgi:glycosyltransferase involved in cell wall biosynthesis
MRILNVNKFYYLRGGSERYFFDLARLLESRGHEVIPFSMKGDRNVASNYDDFFVSEVDFRDPASWRGRLRASLRVLYSLEARRKIRNLIRQTGPRVGHLHNFAHQLSPSILGPMKDAGMRIVQTLHDYKLVCPTYRFYADDQVCERCRSGKYFEAVRMRCNGGSLGASIVNALEMTLHHRILRLYRHVDTFVAPSRFMREKVIEFGVADDRVVQLPYYLDLSAYPESSATGEYMVFVGRLSEEKGIFTLLRAMRDAGDLPLLVVGEGPMEPGLRRAAEEGAPGRVKFLGHLDGTELRDTVARSRCVVVPSEWYENSPLAIYEAFALGRPVVGSRIGGIPELVIHEKTGLLFEPGNVDGLAEGLRRLSADPELARSLGRQARAEVETLCDPDLHLARLQDIYGEAVQ